jgi:hypothetical protein
MIKCVCASSPMQESAVQKSPTDFFTKAM